MRDVALEKRSGSSLRRSFSLKAARALLTCNDRVTPMVREREALSLEIGRKAVLMRNDMLVGDNRCFRIECLKLETVDGISKWERLPQYLTFLREAFRPSASIAETESDVIARISRTGSRLNADLP